MALKILFLTPWYPDEKQPHHGVFVRDQAAALGLSHNVVVISSKVDYTTFGLLSWRVQTSAFENISEHRIVMRRSLPLINQLNYLFLSIWVAWKIARRFRPDIVHGNIAYPGGIWAYCVAALISRPFVVSDHTSRFTDNFRSALHRILTIFALKRAQHVVAVSTWAARQIERVIGRKVEIVPNVIHAGQYEVHDFPSGPVSIGFLGGLSSEIHRKGLDILLRAVAGIHKEFVLQIGGQGRYLEYYKNLAAENGVLPKCVFHGFVAHVPDFMSNLHFFISSSRIEAFGMVIAEAMASGLPVVSTDSGGPADFVSRENGLLVPVGDVEKLRNAIEWMINHFSEFDRGKIRTATVSAFSAETFVSRMQGLYGNVSAGSFPGAR